MCPLRLFTICISLQVLCLKVFTDKRLLKKSQFRLWTWSPCWYFPARSAQRAWSQESFVPVRYHGSLGEQAFGAASTAFRLRKAAKHSFPRCDTVCLPEAARQSWFNKCTGWDRASSGVSGASRHLAEPDGRRATPGGDMIQEVNKSDMNCLWLQP